MIFFSIKFPKTKLQREKKKITSPADGQSEMINPHFASRANRLWRHLTNYVKRRAVKDGVLQKKKKYLCPVSSLLVLGGEGWRWGENVSDDKTETGGGGIKRVKHDDELRMCCCCCCCLSPLSLRDATSRNRPRDKINYVMIHLAPAPRFTRVCALRRCVFVSEPRAPSRSN